MLKSTRSARALCAVLALMMAAGCSGDSSSTGTDEVASVTLSDNAATLRPGETLQLSATPRAANGTPLTDRPVTWSSTADAVASVSSDGLVTAQTLGSATIRAESEGRQGSANITVVAPVAAVEISPATATLLVGQTQQLTATPRDAEDEPLIGRAVTWESSNTTVATVSSTGLVTAAALGTATITATSEEIEGAATITVATVAPPPDGTPPGLVSLELMPDTVVLTAAGGTLSVTLHVTDAGGGVQSVTVNLSSDTENRTLFAFDYAPAAGTRTDGTWILEIPIPADAPLGDWHLTLIAIRDVAGNFRTWDTQQLEDAGFPTLVHVRH